jgi:hypothetical protein
LLKRDEGPETENDSGIAQVDDEDDDEDKIIEV